MSQPILELKDQDVFYGPIQALKKVSMHINEGETVSLIGSNGAGKSTLLMSIFGQPRAAAGQILYQGVNITQKSSHYIASNGIAQSPEGRRVFPDMTVEENLLMGTIPIGDKHASEDMQRMFELFPRLKERRTQRAMTMSGGEQQMLAIARALMSRPKLLLLDEPSLGLAPIVVKQIFATLRELAAIVSGRLGELAPARFATSKKVADGYEYSFPSDPRLSSLTLDFQGKPRHLTGRGVEPWRVDFEDDEVLPGMAASVARRLVLTTPGGATLTLRVKTIQPRPAPYPAADLELPVPPSVMVRPLDASGSQGLLPEL